MQLSRFRHFLSRTLLIHKYRIDIHLVAPGKQQACGLKFFIILKVIDIMVKATNITSAINIKLLLSQAMINYGWKFYPHQKWVMNPTTDWRQTATSRTHPARFHQENMRRTQQMISVLIGWHIRSVIGPISVVSFLRHVDDSDFVILKFWTALL